MHAHDRFLPEWFNRVRSHQITLPRFQRFVAWGHSEVCGLLTTVLRGLPSGAALILEVGDEEKFRSRAITGAPDQGGRVTEQLLDGQQRLTALWCSLHDRYKDRTYFVTFESDEDNADVKQPAVIGQSRWVKNTRRFPVWADDAKECWNRKYIPVSLLRPEDISSDIDAWLDAATRDIEDIAKRYGERDVINKLIQNLRLKVREFNLPYLSLPAATARDVALDVFVKMNTSSVKLTTYDIVVALVEDGTGNSLHDHVNNLIADAPRIAEYVDVPSTVLDIVALMQDRTPGQAGYKGIDYTKMLADWPLLAESVKGLVAFLEEESVFDAQRLPSYTPLPVIAALWQHLPTQPDKLGNARLLLRQYLWRSFLTARYEQSSSSNALQDYRKIRDSLKSGDYVCTAPIFALDLPDKELLIKAGWPKSKTILGRGLLALALKCGAEDMADGLRASVASITSSQNHREYHHLFPASTLEAAGLEGDEIYRALNCALITWKTNRVISNKDPVSYLKERAQNSSLGHEEMVRRLRTHLIPVEPLSVGYDELSGSTKSEKVIADYKVFLEKRAEIMEKAVAMACQGKALQVEALFAQSMQEKAA